MCITVNKAHLSKTKILCLPLNNGNHFLAYSNKVQNLSGKPNAMILAIPGTTKQEWFHNTTEYKEFLDEITRKATDEEWSGLRSRGMHLSKSLRLETFDLGMYTIGLTDSFDGVDVFLASLPEEKRPEVSDALKTFFRDAYKGWSFAVCCFDTTKTMDAQPIALEYTPFHPGSLYFPTVDGHDGGAPDLNAMVDVDHTFIFDHAGQFEVAGKRKRSYATESIKLDAPVPEFLKERKYRFINVRGEQRNGDTFIEIDEMSALEVADDPALHRRMPTPHTPVTA